ncbi:MAG: DNA polymerase III subunit delta [Bacteroidetes bacterium]|nr:MAG: DNA polymerase III subunit delta [Bacteroidota bacterium]
MIWVLYGTDSYRRTERRKALLTELVGNAPPEFALTIWRGRDLSEEHLRELYELPFLAPYKVVALLEAEALSKPVREALKKYLERPAAHTHLILEFAQEAKPSLPEAPGLVWEAYAPLRPAQVADWLADKAHQMGLTLEAEALSLLLETLGPDLHLLHQSLSLLAVYALSAPQKPLTPAEVSQALGLNPQYTVYQLVEALAEANVRRLLQILSRFAEDTRTYPWPQVLWHLRQFFQNLAYLYLKFSQRPDTRTLQKELDLRYPFQARPYEKAWSRYSLVLCREALQILYQAEAQHKGLIPGGATESELLLTVGLKLAHRLQKAQAQAAEPTP